ncbi:MAG TPA: class A beta-lactamase [Candidatus Elarobacter sp.]|nr:class A beta-lactamase [Candidatus Elarobacter sp.]
MNRTLFLSSLAAAATTPPPAAFDLVSARAFPAEERLCPGRLGVAAIDLHSGHRVLERWSQRFPMASTFKLPLVMAVLSRVDRGKERLDRAIAFGASDLLAYSPIAGLQPHGGKLTVAALCAAAIEHSDNAAANLLLRTVGGPAGVTAYLRSIGDPVTRLDRTEPALNDAIPGDVRDTTTPEAMAGTLVRLLRDPILSAASKTRLLQWLRGSQTGAARIRAGVPAGWHVGDKTGTTNSGANDVAILWPPTGAPIVLAMYFAEVKGSDAARDSVFGAVARNVIRRFRG